MTDMDVPGPVFPRYALRQIAQRSLGGCKGREIGFAAQAAGSAREEQGSAAMLEQKRYCRSSQWKSAERVFPPMPCEALFAHLQEQRRLVSARVVNRDGKRRE